MEEKPELNLDHVINIIQVELVELVESIEPIVPILKPTKHVVVVAKLS